ncbi:MAG: hypothetical protein V1913_07210 [Fibrobacterota bacterium]
MQSLDFYGLFIKPLEQCRLEYMITGSVAAIVYGEPRLTHDIDLVLQIPASTIPGILQAFHAPDYYCPPQEILESELRKPSRAHFNLIHMDSGLKADCYPFTDDRLTCWGMQNRRQMELDDGHRAWFAPPEYVVVRKLEYYIEGESQKHLSDIRNMLNVAGEGIDLTVIRQFLDAKGVRLFDSLLSAKETI